MNKTTNELFAFQNSAQRERDLEKHKFKILKAYKEGSVTGLAAKEEQRNRRGDSSCLLLGSRLLVLT